MSAEAQFDVAKAACSSQLLLSGLTWENLWLFGHLFGILKPFKPKQVDSLLCSIDSGPLNNSSIQSFYSLFFVLHPIWFKI
jgi:hypothetical protein